MRSPFHNRNVVLSPRIILQSMVVFTVLWQSGVLTQFHSNEWRSPLPEPSLAEVVDSSSLRSLLLHEDVVAVITPGHNVVGSKKEVASPQDEAVRSYNSTTRVTNSSTARSHVYNNDALSSISVRAVVTGTKKAVPRHQTIGNVVLSQRFNCSVLIINKPDFHFEVLESVALRYPFDWERFEECQNSPSILINFALAQHHAESPSFTGEQKGWKQYYQIYLHGTVQTRPVDGRQIVFGDLVDSLNYTQQYALYVDASLDKEKNFTFWLQQKERGQNRRYGILHKACPNCTREELKHTCRLSPIRKDLCFFLPLDLPAVEVEKTNQTQNGKVSICTSGRDRDYELLAKAIGHFSIQQQHQINVLVFRRPTRSFYRQMKNLSTQYEHINMTTIYEQDYYKFYQSLVQRCDIFLPLIDPATHPHYFALEKGKKAKKQMLTGAMTILLGYSSHLATAIPKSLFDIYGPYIDDELRVAVYHDPYPTNQDPHAVARQAGSDNDFMVHSSLASALSELIQNYNGTQRGKVLSQKDTWSFPKYLYNN